MRRRSFLASTAALAAPSIVPTTARAAGSLLKVIPESDLPILDPVWTTATVSRNHGYMVFDTLYSMDADFRTQPQMAAGHTVENDGKLWTITLRDGMKFHDGEPVRGRDAVASIRRFAARDSFGAALIAATDELTAPSDNTIRFRLRKPFALLPAALGKPGTPMPCIMPERLALTDPNKQVTEMIGSGPFRFVAAERVPGSRVVYEKFQGYIPRADGPATFTAGPKRAFFDRVEWHVIPDSSTKVNALLAGEIDWIQEPPPDLLGMMRASSKVRVVPMDPAGGISIMRFNTLYPPFDNPAIRRALFGAVDQSEFMTAALGDDTTLWKTRVSVFSPGTPMDSGAGIEALTSKRDLDKVRREIIAAGYKGEKVVVLGAVDNPVVNALCLVGADVLKRIGMNVDFQAIDWGTTIQRRASKQPPDKGGWNVFFTNLNGPNNFDPASQLGIRGNGANAWFGWPTMPRIEALREQWFDATSLDEQKRVCAEIERQFFIDAPYIPLGCMYGPTAFSSRLTGVRNGFIQFYDVKPA